MGKKLKSGDLRRMIVEEILAESPSAHVQIHPESGPLDVSMEIDPYDGAPVVRFGNSFTLSRLSADDLIKLSQMFRQASELAEGKIHTNVLQEYEKWVDEDGNVWNDEGEVERRGSRFGRRHGGETSRGTGSSWGKSRGSYNTTSRSRSRSASNPELIALMDDLVTQSPKSGFIGSIRNQVGAGRRLTPKQKAVMKKILVSKGMNDKLSLFECGELNDPLSSDVYSDENVTNLSLDPQRADELPVEDISRSVNPWRHESDY